jgi:hypothetical protein
MKPRIFLGSSGKQAKLLQALTRGLAEVAEVEPWTTVFNPGVSTLDRLVELTGEVDFAAFVFAQDDWTSGPPEAGANATAPAAATTSATVERHEPGQASPRDNVVFEAGLFGGALGKRRTFILHAKGAKLPSDLLGMTAVRYPPEPTPADMREVLAKLRKAIEAEGARSRIEGDWWQHSLTVRTDREPSAISLLRISRDRDNNLEIHGRGWQEDGTLSARYWSVAAKERHDPPAVFYYFNGERPRHPGAPQFEGTGEIRLEDVDRASGYWLDRSETDLELHERTAGIYLRADPADMAVLDGADLQARLDLIALRLREWKAIASS